MDWGIFTKVIFHPLRLHCPNILRRCAAPDEEPGDRGTPMHDHHEPTTQREGNLRGDDGETTAVAMRNNSPGKMTPPCFRSSNVISARYPGHSSNYDVVVGYGLLKSLSDVRILYHVSSRLN